MISSLEAELELRGKEVEVLKDEKIELQVGNFSWKFSFSLLRVTRFYD